MPDIDAFPPMSRTHLAEPLIIYRGRDVRLVLAKDPSFHSVTVHGQADACTALLMHAGTGNCQIGTNELPVGPDQLFLGAPGESFRLSCRADAGQRAVLLALYYKQPYQGSQFMIPSSHSRPAGYSVCLSPVFCQYAGQIIAELTGRRIDYQRQIDRLCELLAVQLLRQFQVSARPRVCSPVAVGRILPIELMRVIEDLHVWLQQNLGSPLAIGIWAARAGVKPIHLIRHFQVRYGCSPNQMHSRLRLDSALKLLGETEQKICSIATLCGIRSASRLAILVRRKTGLTPTQYRSQHAQVRQAASDKASLARSPASK